MKIQLIKLEMTKNELERELKKKIEAESLMGGIQFIDMNFGKTNGIFMDFNNLSTSEKLILYFNDDKFEPLSFNSLIRNEHVILLNLKEMFKKFSKQITESFLKKFIKVFNEEICCNELFSSEIIENWNEKSTDEVNFADLFLGEKNMTNIEERYRYKATTYALFINLKKKKRIYIYRENGKLTIKEEKIDMNKYLIYTTKGMIEGKKAFDYCMKTEVGRFLLLNFFYEGSKTNFFDFKNKHILIEISQLENLTDAKCEKISTNEYIIKDVDFYYYFNDKNGDFQKINSIISSNNFHKEKRIIKNCEIITLFTDENIIFHNIKTNKTIVQKTSIFKNFSTIYSNNINKRQIIAKYKNNHIKTVVLYEVKDHKIEALKAIVSNEKLKQKKYYNLAKKKRFDFSFYQGKDIESVFYLEDLNLINEEEQALLIKSRQCEKIIVLEKNKIIDLNKGVVIKTNMQNVSEIFSYIKNKKTTIDKVILNDNFLFFTESSCYKFIFDFKTLEYAVFVSEEAIFSIDNVKLKSLVFSEKNNKFEICDKKININIGNLLKKYKENEMKYIGETMEKLMLIGS